MIKIGEIYRVKRWKELKKASNGKFLGCLDFGPIVFLLEMEPLCEKKIRIIARDNWYKKDHVYRGQNIETGEQYLFTENMLIKPGLMNLIEVRNESKSRAKV